MFRLIIENFLFFHLFVPVGFFFARDECAEGVRTAFGIEVVIGFSPLLSQCDMFFGVAPNHGRNPDDEKIKRP